MPVSRTARTMSRNNSKLALRQPHVAAAAISFLSDSSSSRRDRPYSFTSLNLGTFCSSFHFIRELYCQDSRFFFYSRAAIHHVAEPEVGVSEIQTTPFQPLIHAKEVTCCAK